MAVLLGIKSWDFHFDEPKTIDESQYLKFITNINAAIVELSEGIPKKPLSWLWEHEKKNVKIFSTCLVFMLASAFLLKNFDLFPVLILIISLIIGIKLFAGFLVTYMSAWRARLTVINYQYRVKRAIENSTNYHDFLKYFSTHNIWKYS